MKIAARVLAALLVAFALPASARWENFGTDQIVVRLKPGAALAERGRGRELAAQLGALTGENLRYRRTMGDGAKVIRLRKRLPLPAVEAIARSMTRHAQVQQALVDRIALPAVHDDPDDPQFASQWSLNATDGIRASSAWDITTGSSQQIVAIVDTGLLPHADIGAGRILAGYDFVSDADKPRANDGDGRDLDPTDPGDWITAEEAATETYLGCAVADSSWHGTVMAGIVAADTDNALGIAGINRNTKVLPVRALGKCVGYSSDIADAIRWAAGFTVSEVPDNLNPADVILLSVSIPTAGACDAILQTAISEAAISANVPVIVPAGNQAGAASAYSPANCLNVIAVGAVLRDGGIPSYANTGSPIALSAPGGTGTDPSTAVLATSDSGLTAAANDSPYAGRSGTSIAAAHVAGVVSLVQAVNPSLTPAKIRDIIRNTTRAFPAGAATPCTTTACGSGILDARAALQAALAYGVATPQVAGGTAHSGGVRSDGTLWTWGSNTFGRLGDNTTMPRLNPIQVQYNGAGHLSDGLQLALGDGHSLAVRADTSGWSWGSNTSGRLGDGTTTQRSGAVQVCSQFSDGSCTSYLTGITQLAAGQGFSIALRNDGTVWAWGANDSGQLGNGTTSFTATTIPAQVCAPLAVSCSAQPLTGVIAIAAGDAHGLALKSDGTVVAWGSNGGGRLGDSTTTTRSTPVTVCDTSGCGASLTGVIAIAGGVNHSLAVKSDGTVFGWGSNGAGQLGTGCSTDQPITCATTNALPVQVLAAADTPLSGITAVSAGTSYSVALKSNGTVRTFGSNTNGQLGNGSTATVSPAYPVQPAVGGVVAIAAGDLHALAMMNDGTVQGWGLNSDGQVGNGATASSQPTPTFVQASGGGNFSLQLNVASFIAQFDAPLQTVRQSNTITVATGGAVAIAGGDYSIGCSGSFTTSNGTLPNGSTVCVRVVTSAACATLTTATLSVAGSDYPFEVTTEACDNTPAAFTFVPQGGVPLSSQRTSNAVTISGINTASPISITDGTYSIGCNGSFTADPSTIVNNQTVCMRVTAAATNDTVTQTTLTIGSASAAFHVTTLVTSSFVTPMQVAAGPSFSAGLRTDGTAFLWGSNGNGQLGDGTLVNRITPLRLLGATGLKQLALGFAHALALRTDGSVWSWGYNAHGQLGDGTTSQRRSPAPVPSLSSGVTKIAAGFLHSLALKSDGSVVAWGFNASGQVGDGSSTHRSTPVGVVDTSNAPLASIIDIAAGGDHSLALRSDGTLFAWGLNDHGQMGLGPIGNQPKAVQVLTGVASMAVGSNADHVVVRKGDGTIWAWGRNDFGQIGNGCALSPSNDCSDAFSPVLIPSLTNVAQLAVGERHSVALRADGAVLTWGYNGNGQLGDNTLTSRSSPAALTGLLAGTIGSGASHTLAVRSDGSVVAWGYNGSGQIGDGTTGGNTPAQDRLMPVTALGAGCAGSLNLDMSATVFTAQTEVAMSTQRCSNTIAITGIPDGAPIAITGGEYQIDAASFTNASGTIGNGQSLTLRQTSSASCGITTVATATVNGTPYNFSVTTETCDTTPNGFSFTPQSDVPLNSGRQSNAVTISGINTAVAISVSGAATSEYSVGCNGTFVSTSGTISDGQAVCVRHTSASAVSTVTSTTLTIGGVEATFTSTTAPIRPLSVSVTGAGSGTVASTSPDSAISCPGVCSADYLPDTVVTLEAAPDASSSFAGWSGGCSGTATTCNVTMNAAIGVTATFNLVPPALQSVKSRKTHASAGTFDIVLDTAPAIGGAVSVEPRALASGHRVVFVFDRPITATGTAACVDASAASCGASAAASGNEVEVTIASLADNKRVTVSLTNVNGLSVNVSVSLAFSSGDVDGTRSLTASDILRAKGRVGFAADANTAIYDIDLNGTVAEADVDAVKANAGAEP